MTEQERVYRFLDKQFSGDTFNDYDSREDLLECAIEYVGENNKLTQGCGVGPLISYIESWLNEFEKQSITNETLKYEEKLLYELNQKGFSHKNNVNELKELAIYVYSIEHQQQLLKQTIEQILNKKTEEKIKFSLESSLNEKCKIMFNEFDKKLQIFLNQYVNQEFKIILNENISNLYEAFNIENLQDKKKLKM